MRTILLLALALVAAILIWILALRPDGTGAIEPAANSVIESRATADLHGVSDVVTPSPRTDRTVPVLEPDANANASTTPTLILVRVTAIETDEPVEHMRINAWGEKTLLVLGSRALETDEEGFVEMEVEPGHPLIVNAQGDGITTGSAQVRVEPLRAGERRSIQLSVTTRPDRTVRGTVLRRDTRESLAGVVVEAMSLPASDMGPRVVTGNDGAFSIALRSFATVALRYDHPEFGTALSPVPTNQDGAQKPLEILLDRTASIRARVSAARGRDPSTWVLVATARAADLLQSAGTRDFSIAPLEWSATFSAGLDRLPPNVALSVEIRDGTRVPWRSSQPIVLAPGEERVLECPVGVGTLEGFVRDADGNPARDIEIAILPAVVEGDRRILEWQDFDVKVTCADDGSYRFDDVPLGSWFVVPAVDLHASRHQHRDSVRLAERFEIQVDGDRVVHDIVLVRGSSITGRVVDADGAGIWFATVRGRHESIPGSVDVMTEIDGSFELQPLVPGPWILSAFADGMTPGEEVRVGAGTRDVVLELVTGTTVFVSVSDELGTPIEFASVNVHAADDSGSAYALTTNAKGSVLYTGPARTAIHVVATTRDGRIGILRDVVVDRDSLTRIQVRVRDAGRARLRFDGPGVSAALLVFDSGLLVQTVTAVKGSEVDVTGPIGTVDLQLTVNGKRHDRTITLEREPRGLLVFDGGWK